MTSPTDVARFHAEFDYHTDDRVRLFDAASQFVDTEARVLYAGSYVDIAPSVWFDDVTYVDVDKRAPRFFAQTEAVDNLVASKRQSASGRSDTKPSIAFHHADYSGDLPIEDGSIDLLVSLYAGFISEHCSRYLRPGGLLLTNNSHGDASMATLDERFELVAVVTSSNGKYRVRTDNLDRYLQPKRGEAPTRDGLHATNRGIAYTTSPFAYIFRFNDRSLGVRPQVNS